MISFREAFILWICGLDLSCETRSSNPSVTYACAISRGVRAGAILLLGIMTWSCSSGSPHKSPTIVVKTPGPMSQSGIPGVKCRAYGDNGPGQFNYSPRDAGLPGVPKLSAAELAQLGKIASHSHSSTLRFAVLNFRGRREFIIFDAALGSCSDQAPGYEVLNEKGQNSFYQPGEMPYFTHAGPP